MDAPATITSIEDIQKRKSKIQEELTSSKNAAAKSFSVASNEAQSFILRDLVLPAVGVALAGYLTVKAIRYVTKDHDGDTASVASVTAVPTSLTPKKTASVNRTPVRSAAPKPPLLQSLLRASSILIPAGKAILEVIKEANNE